MLMSRTLSALRAALCAGAAALVAATAPGVAFANPRVIVEEVREGDWITRIEALGTLRPNARVSIAASVTGRIDILHVDDGARVKRGDPLVTLLHDEEKARREEAAATLDEAREQRADAERLFERGVGSETALRAGRRAEAVAAARLSAVEAQIADHLLVAPFDGRIGIRTISPGATVEVGDDIMRLIDDHVLKLDFSVPSTFLNALRPGDAIEATSRAYPGRVFTGRVRAVDAEADPVTRSVLVRALIDNSDGRLLPGLLMEVGLLTDQRRALAVNEASLIPFGADTFVLQAVERDGETRVERVRVEIGARRVGAVEILDGLQAGDLVVVAGALKVRPGQSVNAVRRRLQNGDDAESGGARLDAAARPASVGSGG
ncbi:MAG: efflux RND transporter periplasmic adaptor subunit [Pseudomonadota bacterium]